MRNDICFCLFFAYISYSMSYIDRFLSFQVDVDSGKCLSLGRRTGSNFRERLMKVLKSPYDERQYDYYLDEVSRRRPQVRHRELRSRVLKAYQLDSYGKSYLHIHSGEFS